MTDNTLPEEKLLTLIRKSDEVAVHPSGGKKGLLLRARGNIQRLAGYFSRGQWLAKAINVFFIASLGFFLFSWISRYLPLPGQADISGAGKSGVRRAAAETSIQPLDSYLAEINKKDIFYGSYPKRYDTRDISLDAVRNIALVGIIADDPAQAVIKDKKTGDIFYLKKGERVGEFTLLEIQDGKVVVEYRGEMFEIHL